MRNLTRRFAGPALRVLTRDDRGVTAVLIAVLIGGGVLLGMGALVIDIGQLYQNRAELQNGADAAALAVAQSCALGVCNPAIALQYADANASKLTGGTAAVGLVCGAGGLLPGCPASSGTATDCPAPPAGTNYLDVHTSTLTAGGSPLLPPSFARALLGAVGYQGTSVRACAQATWGAPAASLGFAFTISACTWDQATGQGTIFAPPPPYPQNPLPIAALDQVVKVHSTIANTGCPTEPAGAAAPGNFGWTADPTGTCQVYVSGGTYSGGTGVSASQACKQALATAQASRSLVFLPVFVSVADQGTSATYTLKGFAAFVITGYHLSGFNASDWLNPANDCRGSDLCINGYFTQGLIPATGALGGPNLGATIVKLAG
jgi:Flp pilus assembly protein TadG